VSSVVAFAPGRVNLIGDHTDHTGGLCFPIAIDRGITVDATLGGQRVRLRSDTEDGVADLPLDLEASAARAVEPPWARYVAGVVAELAPATGIDGRVSTTLPAGVGLSSSAALEVAVALALGADLTDPVALARRCQRAEHAARGVPTGILDQLASLSGRFGCALLLDCTALTVTPVPLPDDVEWVVIAPDEARSLGTSAYAERVAELGRSAAVIGPLRTATAADVERLADPVLRRRARHVVTENARVREFAAAVAAGDVATAGALMGDSHRSLSADFESSTTAIDALCAELDRRPGVLGARITGGGWGGAVVALCRPGALDGFPGAITVRPSDGAARHGADGPART
jgi:galactokinase